LSIPPPIPNQVDQYISQINILQSKVNDIKEQIKQSEKNLNAQIDVSEIKKKVKIDYFSVILKLMLTFFFKIEVEETLKIKKIERFNELVRESQLDFNSFDKITNKIIESCTKEAIGVCYYFYL
jgi:hypothetical protein